MKKSLDTETLLTWPSVYGRRGLTTLSILPSNGTCFTSTFGHIATTTKTCKALLNTSTKQAWNIF